MTFEEHRLSNENGGNAEIEFDERRDEARSSDRGAGDTLSDVRTSISRIVGDPIVYTEEQLNSLSFQDQLREAERLSFLTSGGENRGVSRSTSPCTPCHSSAVVGHETAPLLQLTNGPPQSLNNDFLDDPEIQRAIALSLEERKPSYGVNDRGGNCPKRDDSALLDAHVAEIPEILPTDIAEEILCTDITSQLLRRCDKNSENTCSYQKDPSDTFITFEALQEFFNESFLENVDYQRRMSTDPTMCHPSEASAPDDEKAAPRHFDLSPSVTASSSQTRQPSTLTPNFVKKLARVIFGSGRPEDMQLSDIARWLHQGFEFSPHPKSNWGLLQRVGGPCGVLAATQSWMLRQLLFASHTQLRSDEGRDLSASPTIGALSAGVCDEPICDSSDSGSTTAGSIATSRGDANKRLNRHPDCLWACLCEGLGCMLYQCTGISSYYVSEMTLSQKGIQFFSRPDFPSLCRTAELLENADQIFDVHVWTFSRIVDVVKFYMAKKDNLLQSATAVLSFVAAVALTRGLDKVSSDMDDASNSLLGAYGHCSQELVNLLLTGCGSTNVFDGVKQLGGSEGATDLHGVKTEQLLGYLSEHEMYRYCEVGRYYKFPRYPIWIVSGSNHYTTLFSLDATVSYPSADKRLFWIAADAFDSFDVEASCLVSADKLEPILRKIGLSHLLKQARQSLCPPDAGGVLLRPEFINWSTKIAKLQNEAIDERLRWPPPPKRRILYHYDGQHRTACKSHGPAEHVSRFLVEDNDISSLQAQADNELLAQAAAGILRTLWPRCIVTQLTLEQSPVALVVDDICSDAEAPTATNNGTDDDKLNKTKID